MNVLELDGVLLNMHWFTFATYRIVEQPDEGTYHYRVSFHFADGKDTTHNINVDEAGMDAIREALNE